MHGSVSYEIDLNQEPAVRQKLVRAGFRLSDFDYAFWRATNDKYTLTLYRSGKLVIQGKGVERLSGFIANKDFAKHDLSKRIGTDESGKGEYFGALVVAAVLVGKETRKELLRMEVRDSKRLSNRTIEKLAPKIKGLCPHSIVVITPTLYNQSYELLSGTGKLYRILARGHARAIENILGEETCHHAVVDQFGPERFIKKALMEKGKLIKLEYRPHAEDDAAVAAASILARDEYKNGLEALSAKYSIDLPAGASNKVIEVGREFVSRYGKDELREIAKLHFITAKYILDPKFSYKANT